MWRTPDRSTLAQLIRQGLSDSEIAGYYECGVKLIEAYIDEFRLNQNFREKSEPKKMVFKGGVNNTIEKHLAPEKKYKRRSCLSCSGKFESEGAHNRICDGCKRSHERNGLPREFEGKGFGS